MREKMGARGSSKPSRLARGTSRRVRSRGYWRRRLPRAETGQERLGELATNVKDKKERERRLRNILGKNLKKYTIRLPKRRHEVLSYHISKSIFKGIVLSIYLITIYISTRGKDAYSF